MNSSDEEPNDLKRQPIPKGLENNAAFLEYRNLSDKKRQAVRSAAPEVLDIQQQALQRERMNAMCEVIDTQVEALQEDKRQIAHLTAAIQAISAALAAGAKGEKPQAQAMREAIGVILVLNGASSPSEPVKPKETLQ